VNFWLSSRGERIELHCVAPRWVPAPGLWVADGRVTLLRRDQAARDFDVLPVTQHDLVVGTIRPDGTMQLERNGHHG
jgi:hypothetical protein